MKLRKFTKYMLLSRWLIIQADFFRQYLRKLICCKRGRTKKILLSRERETSIFLIVKDRCTRPVLGPPEKWERLRKMEKVKRTDGMKRIVIAKLCRGNFCLDGLLFRAEGEKQSHTIPYVWYNLCWECMKFVRWILLAFARINFLGTNFSQAIGLSNS